MDGTHAVGRSVMMTFGVPVDPLLQIPLVCMPMTSGNASVDCPSASANNVGTSSGRALRIVSRTCSVFFSDGNTAYGSCAWSCSTV